MKFAFGYPSNGIITSAFDDSKTRLLVHEMQKGKDSLLGCFGLTSISCHIPMNRNAICEQFLQIAKTEEYLLMIDTDIEFKHTILEDFDRIIKNEYEKVDSDKIDIIAGRVNIGNGMPVFYNRVRLGEYLPDPKPFKGLKRFDRVGSGIICISKDLLIDLKSCLRGPHWFDHTIEGNIMASDDFSFCAKAERLVGSYIYGAWEIKGEHWKTLPIASNYREEFEEELEKEKDKENGTSTRSDSNTSK